MFYSYGLFQLIAIITLMFWGVWGWESENWTVSVLGATGLVGSAYFIRGFIKLNVWWRQALKHKNPVYEEKGSPLRRKAFIMRFLMRYSLIVLAILLLLYLPTHIGLSIISPEDLRKYFGFFLEVSGASSLGALIHYLFYSSKRGSPSTGGFFKSAEFYTLAYLLLLAGLSTGIVLYDVKPMISWIPYEVFYNNVIVALLVSANAVVAYTVSCQAVAQQTVKAY